MSESSHPSRGRRAVLCSAAVASLPLLWPTAARAQSSAWPAKPIRIIVPFAPGGGVDVLTRAVAAELSQRWKQPLVIENRAGAGSIIGADMVAKARPSTSSAKSISSPCVPHLRLSASIAASWSSNSIFDSYSSRPMSVLLPSSTLPQVMKRSRDFVSCRCRYSPMSVAIRSETWAIRRPPAEPPQGRRAPSGGSERT